MSLCKYINYSSVFYSRVQFCTQVFVSISDYTDCTDMALVYIADYSDVALVSIGDFTDCTMVLVSIGDCTDCTALVSIVECTELMRRGTPA